MRLENTQLMPGQIKGCEANTANLDSSPYSFTDKQGKLSTEVRQSHCVSLIWQLMR